MTKSCLGGCGKPATRRGYCDAHYQHVRKYGYADGTPFVALKKRQPMPCSEQDCEQLAEVRGLCRRHYGNKYMRNYMPRYLQVDYRRLRYRYGLSLVAYQDLVKKAAGACMICGSTEPLCIDHDHVTGQVRGLLCHPCNKGLGNFKDQAVLLDKAKRYLKKKRK